MSSAYYIRDAAPSDIAKINGLFNEAVREGLIDWDKPQPIAFHDKWLERMKGYPLLVAEVVGDQEVIAYGAFEPQCSAEGSSFMHNSILHLVAKTDCRRQGVATALWDALCAHQLTSDRDVYLIIWHVLSNNKAALGLAQALNFHLDGKVDKMAVKGSSFVDQIWYSYYLGSAPCCQGLGYPPNDLFDQSPSPTGSELRLQPPKFTIRDATMADLPFLVEIYNDVILNSTALEFWLPKTEDERRQWLQRLLEEKYPCLIAIEDEEPLGYISLTPWNSHPDQSYRHTAYISAYVRKDLKRRSIGENLYLALLKHRYIKDRQIIIVIAGITAINGSAIAGAMKGGFRLAATRQRKLVKFGEAHAAVCLTREFGPQPDLQ